MDQCTLLFRHRNFALLGISECHFFVCHLWFHRLYLRLKQPARDPRCGYTATALPFYIFLFWELRVLSPNFHIHVSVNNLYSPRIGPHISSSRKGRPSLEIYNSLTDTWMWKLGLRPQYSFTGNICFKFSAFCLCSVVPYSLSAFPGPVRLLPLVPDRGLYHIFFSAK